MTYTELASFITIAQATSSIVSFLILIGFLIVNAFFRKQLDHVYAQAIERYKAELLVANTEQIESIKAEITREKEKDLKEIQKILDIAFRDEQPRNVVLANTIMNADKERLNVYKTIYTLFFKILFSHDKILSEKDPTTQKKMIQALYDEINEVRISIFTNSLYLGKLIEFLLPAQIGLWDDLSSIQQKINGSWKGYNGEYSKSSEQLRNAEKWILENMKPYLTLNHIELSDETIEDLHKKRVELIKEKLS